MGAVKFSERRLQSDSQRDEILKRFGRLPQTGGTVRCAEGCGWTYVGELLDGSAALREQRATVHSEILVAKAKRKHIHRGKAQSERAEQIRRILTEHGPLRTAEIAERLGIAPATTRHILTRARAELGATQDRGFWKLAGMTPPAIERADKPAQSSIEHECPRCSKVVRGAGNFAAHRAACVPEDEKRLRQAENQRRYYAKFEQVHRDHEVLSLGPELIARIESLLAEKPRTIEEMSEILNMPAPALAPALSWARQRGETSAAKLQGGAWHRRSHWAVSESPPLQPPEYVPVIVQALANGKPASSTVIALRIGAANGRSVAPQLRRCVEYGAVERTEAGLWQLAEGARVD